MNITKWNPEKEKAWRTLLLSEAIRMRDERIACEELGINWTDTFEKKK